MIELKVMTWNVHCSEGADNDRQRRIADLILKEDADFVLLNEYNQDSCKVVDSLLKRKYQFTEESRSHRLSGDIFYSKIAMFNSGRIDTPVQEKNILVIRATVTTDIDTVQLFGIHLLSNRYKDCSDEKDCEFKNDFYSAFQRYKKAQITRCFQAERIKQEMAMTKYPIIVMGDMNDFNKSKPLDILCSSGLNDSWWEGGNGYGATFHDGWMRLRIDHILHSKELKLESIKVINTELSDHNPVVAGFSVSK